MLPEAVLVDLQQRPYEEDLQPQCGVQRHGNFWVFMEPELKHMEERRVMRQCEFEKYRYSQNIHETAVSNISHVKSLDDVKVNGTMRGRGRGRGRGRCTSAHIAYAPSSSNSRNGGDGSSGGRRERPALTGMLEDDEGAAIPPV